MVKVKNMLRLCYFSFTVSFHCLSVPQGTGTKTHAAQIREGVGSDT